MTRDIIFMGKTIKFRGLPKAFIPSQSINTLGGWINHSCKVKFKIIYENIMDYRGSKTENNSVKSNEYMVVDIISV